MNRSIALLCALALLSLGGCASIFSHPGARQAGSIVDYLYPGAKLPPALEPAVARLRLPVRVGIAFVPGGGRSAGLPEAAQAQLLERVKAAFSQYDYIGSIGVIPSAYLRPRGAGGIGWPLALMLAAGVWCGSSWMGRRHA
jgi:rhombotail lipoprotein